MAAQAPGDDPEAGGGDPDAPWLERLRTAGGTTVGRFTSASNATLLLALHDEGEDPPTIDEDGAGAGLLGLDPHRFAVYKPRLGEAPLWDFEDGTLWKRELAAWVVDRAIGLGMVPTTVPRDDLEHGVGVLQRVVPHDPEEHYFTLRDDEGLRDQLRRMVVFDVLLDNADRKGGHLLLERTEEGRRVRLIDHGVCFHAEPHLRTVAWDFAGEPLREEERELGALLGRLLDEDDPSVAALAGLLSRDELEQLRVRAHRVATMQRFPHPVHDRQVPWPLL